MSESKMKLMASTVAIDTGNKLRSLPAQQFEQTIPPSSTLK